MRTRKGKTGIVLTICALSFLLRDRVQANESRSIWIPNGSIIDLVSIEDLERAMVPAAVRAVRVQSYYRDLADSGAAATWIRAARGSHGPGIRRSANGTAWALAETVINPSMLGGRNDDRVRRSDTAIAEALSLANGGLPGETRAGGRTIVFSAPRMIPPFPRSGGAYVVSNEIRLQPGVAIIVQQGAEILAAPHFKGQAIVASADDCAWQCVGARIEIDGTLNANSNAPFGILLRSATKVSVTVPGQVIHAPRGALHIGSKTALIPPFENVIGPFNGYAQRGRWPATNDPEGVGLELERTTDNLIHDVVVVGYRIGYRDAGQNNDLRDAHIYTAGERTDGYGPLAICYDLEGGHALIDDAYCDTPTAMQDRSIKMIAAFRLGTHSEQYIIRDPRVFLNYDNLANNTPPINLPIHRIDNKSSIRSGNVVDYIYVYSANDQITALVCSSWAEAMGRIIHHLSNFGRNLTC